MQKKPAKPNARRPRPRKPGTSRPNPSHLEIAKRAYFLHLEHPGSDELGNWLRAERELAAA